MGVDGGEVTRMGIGVGERMEGYGIENRNNSGNADGNRSESGGGRGSGE